MTTKVWMIVSILLIVAIASVWVYSFMVSGSGGTSISQPLQQKVQQNQNAPECVAPECQCFSERVNASASDGRQWNNVYVCVWL